MRPKRDITALTHELMKLSRIIENVCALVEQDADPNKILFQTRRAHKALNSIQQALIESEKALCIDEVVKLKSIPSKIERLKSHMELISRYGH